jgi:hypothetical protein
MEHLREEIQALAAKLAASHPPPGSTEETVLALLLDLAAAANRVKDLRLLNFRIRALENVYLHSVAWCSVLSKQIEKILILYEDLVATG